MTSTSISLFALNQTRERWQQQLHATRSQASYNAGWKKFADWCSLTGCSALPALPEMIELFVVWCLEERNYRFATVELYLAAISDRHRRAGYSGVVSSARLLLRLARRQITELPGNRKALTPEQLRAISRHLDTGRPIDVRNRALLVLGFAAGWRGSELGAIDLTHVQFSNDRKEITLWLPRSKTDQQGRGREIRIPCGVHFDTCPVRLLESWLKVRGDRPGAIFTRMSGKRSTVAQGIGCDQINLIVKQALESIGVDTKRYGSHSLRVGMITAATECGAQEVAIMQRSGHRNLNSLARYVRPARGLRYNPLRGVL